MRAALSGDDDLDEALSEAIDHQRIYGEGGDTVDALFAERSRRIEAGNAARLEWERALSNSATADEFDRALQGVVHSWTADIQLDLFVNQADRDAMVLAVIDNQMIVEYEMPNGTTGLQLLDIEANLAGLAPFRWRRTYSYTRVPRRWLRAIEEQSDAPYWLGRSAAIARHGGYRGPWPIPFPAAN